MTSVSGENKNTRRLGQVFELVQECGDQVDGPAQGCKVAVGCGLIFAGGRPSLCLAVLLGLLQSFLVYDIADLLIELNIHRVSPSLIQVMVHERMLWRRERCYESR